jgi:hypothetical protein
MRMMADGTVLLWLDGSTSAPTRAQFERMLTDLGQPTTDRHAIDTVPGRHAAFAAVVARVRALAGL